MTFINPYNFVSLGEKRADAPRAEGELLSGYLDCGLTTLSPLFIPNPTNSRVLEGKPAEHNSYEFFSYEDLSDMPPGKDGCPPRHPVIPGSSLRGALRSVFEALTNSCLSTLTDFPLRSRVPTVGRPGLLFCKFENEKEAWTLQPAKRYLVQTGPCASAVGPLWRKNGDAISLPGHNDLTNKKTGDIITFNASVDYINGRRINCGTQAVDFGKGSLSGVLLVGEYYNKKHFDHVFAAADEKAIPLDAAAVARLQQVLADYRDSTINKAVGHNRYQGYQLGLARRKAGLPVFYYQMGAAYYLAPAMLSRSFYLTKLTELAKAQGNYHPCSDSKDLCPACALFGMAGDQSSLGSRVRVSDCDFVGEPQFDPFKVLQPLLQPHVSSMEFYTDARSGTFRTYDYQINYQGNQAASSPYSNQQPLRLRGRKMYWHGNNQGMAAAILPTAFNATVRPLSKGANFRFRLYFRDISEAELRQLVSLVNLTPDLAHKLGRGKPLGFGSARMRIEAVKLRKVELMNGQTERRVSYGLSDWEELPGLIRDAAAKRAAFDQAFVAYKEQAGFKDALALLACGQTNKMVLYPGYTFFGKNRVSINAPRYLHVLPGARDKEQSLPLEPARPR